MSRRFPGIKLKHFEIRDSDFVPRVIAEAQSGAINLDVAQGNLAASSPLFERGLIQKHDDWTKLFKDFYPAAAGKGGDHVYMYNLITPIAYNTQLVQRQDVPTSWDDLLLPKWKGKIIVDPQSIPLSFLGLKWGQERLVSYVTALAKQEPKFVESGTGVIRQLAAGAGHLAVGTYVHFVYQHQKRGAPVDWAKQVSPLGAASQLVYSLKGARHPNAAKLFMGWLGTAEAQKKQQEWEKAAAVPGSDYIVVKIAEANKVEILVETVENYRLLAQMRKAAIGALGVK
jgi:iron(III) transport system substrate-binding protein